MARIVRLFTLLSLFILAALPVLAGEGAPALWRVKGDAATLYLFGTIHLLPPQTKWQSDAVMAAVQASTSLTLEIEDPQAATPEITQYTLEHGLLRDGRTLVDIVGEDNFQMVSTVSQNIGLPPQGLLQMRPWLASISLTLHFAQVNGFQSDSGAEAWLTKAFRQMDKPILGLEEPLIAIRSLANQSDEVQTVLLTDTAEQLEDGGEVLHEMHDAWLRGDVDALSPLLIEPLAERPEIYEAILLDRNHNWLPKLEVLMETGGVHFVAVGTAHLIGEDSLINLLKAKGYEVERLAETLK